MLRTNKYTSHDGRLDGADRKAPKSERLVEKLVTRANVRMFNGRLLAASAYEACVNNAEESRCHGAP